jgi:hypothetical protein
MKKFHLEYIMKTRVYVLSLLALAMASFLLVHFGLIWTYGKFYIYESNPVVLILETTGIVAILGFSFYCLMEQLRGAKVNQVEIVRGHETPFPEKKKANL